MHIVPVYRSGQFHQRTHDPSLETFYQMLEHFDTFRTARNPVGRQGAFYASPTLYGVTRWVAERDKTFHLHQKSVEVFEFLMDADTTMVYPIRHWEDYYVGYNSSARRYWDQGMTLASWLEQGFSDMVGTEYEILFTPEDMLSTPTPVPLDRILDVFPREPVRQRFVEIFAKHNVAS